MPEDSGADEDMVRDQRDADQPGDLTPRKSGGCWLQDCRAVQRLSMPGRHSGQHVEPIASRVGCRGPLPRSLRRRDERIRPHDCRRRGAARHGIRSVSAWGSSIALPRAIRAVHRRGSTRERRNGRGHCGSSTVSSTRRCVGTALRTVERGAPATGARGFKGVKEKRRSVRPYDDQRQGSGSATIRRTQERRKASNCGGSSSRAWTLTSFASMRRVPKTRRKGKVRYWLETKNTRTLGEVGDVRFRRRSAASDATR